MNEPTPPITGQAAKLTTSLVHDADETTLVCVVHLNAKPIFAECLAVTRAGASHQVGRSPEGWRIDSASAVAFNDGTVRLYLSSYPDSASGTAAAIRWIDFPDAVEPSAPATIDQGARDLANAAAKQANYATNVATQAKERADAAVSQANANAAVNTAQAEQIAALDGRVQTLEAGA